MTESPARATCLAVLTALAVVGCNDNLSTSGVADELTTDIGSTLRDEVEASVNAFTIGRVLAR